MTTAGLIAIAIAFLWGLVGTIIGCYGFHEARRQRLLRSDAIDTWREAVKKQKVALEKIRVDSQRISVDVQTAEYHRKVVEKISEHLQGE